MTAGDDGHVARWHGRMFQEETPLLELGAVARYTVGRIHAVMAPQRPLLAVLTAANNLQVWDWERRALVREWNHRAETGPVIPYHFNADGTKLLVTTDDVSIREWDIETGRETRSIKVPAATGPRNVAISPDGTQAVIIASGTSGAAESVRLDLISGRVTTHKLNVLQVLFQPTVSPDGKLLVVTSSMGYAKVFDTATYRETATLSGFMFGVHGAGYSPDQQRLAIGSTAFEALTLWDVHNYERLLTLPSPVGALTPLAFSPDGNVLAGGGFTVGTGGMLHFWRAPSWAEIEKAEAAERTAAAAKPSPTATTP